MLSAGDGKSAAEQPCVQVRDQARRESEPIEGLPIDDVEDLRSAGGRGAGRGPIGGQRGLDRRPDRRPPAAVDCLANETRDADYARQLGNRERPGLGVALLGVEREAGVRWIVERLGQGGIAEAGGFVGPAGLPLRGQQIRSLAVGPR